MIKTKNKKIKNVTQKRKKQATTKTFIDILGIDQKMFFVLGIV